MRLIILYSLTLGALLTSGLGAASPEAERNWPMWRGPNANGVSLQANPPLEWSEKKNIKWKVEIPGRGSSSPIVWGDRLYLLSAVPSNIPVAGSHNPRGGINPRVPHRFMVYAIDRHTGKTLWEKVAREATPHEASHPDNGTWASSSAVTDGEHVIAFFESEGLYAYDMNGALVWQKDLGDKTMRNEFGEGTTPALHGNRLVVVWDHFVPGASFIITFDKATGREIWRAKRDEIDTWATPLVVDAGGHPQVIVNGMNKIRSYDLETGTVVWEAPGTTMNPIPSPVYEKGVAFLMSGFRGNNLKAIRLADAKGDLTGSKAILWEINRDTPYVPSPLLYDGILYFLKTNSGILSAFDAQSGKPHYQAQRLAELGEVFSSPVGAQGRVYITGRDGVTLVVRNSPKYEVLAKNTLEDGFDASPALVETTMYMRGYKFLYAISGQ
jgi:outer membrane protein assembly factor BamB